MKKVLLFIAAGILMFCLAPIATTQAHVHASIVFSSANVVLLEVEPHIMITKSDSMVFKNNIIAHDISGLNRTTIARGENRPDRNPYVKRRGYGVSDMADYVDNESTRNKGVEDEVPDDNSAVEFNEELKDSSDYNEDL